MTNSDDLADAAVSSSVADAIRRGTVDAVERAIVGQVDPAVLHEVDEALGVPAARAGNRYIGGSPVARAIQPVADATEDAVRDALRAALDKMDAPAPPTVK